MKKLAEYFLDNTFVVNLLSALIILLGLVSLFNMKRDLISHWESKKIEVKAQLVGAGPAQMEKFVTYPIEKALRNVPGVEKITSNSTQSNSTIKLHLKDSVDNISDVEQQVKDEIASIESDLPEDIKNLKVRHIKQTKAWFNYYAILGFNENSDQHQSWLLRVKEDLTRVDGVASVDTYNRTKDLFIKVDPAALGRYEIKLDQIYDRINETFKIYPLGKIKKNGTDYSLEIENLKYSPKAVENISLKTNASFKTLKIGDVAKVEYRLPKRSTKNFTLGQESVAFNIFKDFSADSINLKETIDKKITEINESTPAGVKVISVEEGPDFIIRQINALKSNAFFGVILVITTLCLFLGLRNALMTSFGLPLAYLFTFIVLENLNVSMDLISVVGMLLVIGIIVDDAIIISEQYMQNLEAGLTPRDSAIQAVLTTWKPICGTVATTMIAFLPILLGRDSMSTILWAIPVVVFTALGISLFESFFILPNHLQHFVPKAKGYHESKRFQRFKEGYEKLLKSSLRYRYFVISSLVVTMIVSVMFAKEKINFNFNLNISSESVRFIGELKESDSIEESREKIKKVEAILAQIPKEKYKLYELGIGKNQTNGKEMRGPQYFNFWISFSQLDENVANNKKYVKDFLKRKIVELKETGLFERLEVKIHKGGREEDREDIVEVIIRSLNPFNADEVTSNVKKIIEDKKIKGITSVDLDESLFNDAWVFIPNIQQVQSTGLTLNDITSQLALYVRSQEVYEHNLGNKSLKIFAYIEEGEKLNFKELNKLPVFLRNGNKLPISKFGKWIKQKRQGSIKHLDLMRKVVVDLPFDKENIKKEVLISRVKEIETDLQRMYPDLYFSIQDADEQSKKNKSSILKKFLFALVGIFFVLALVLRSVMQPILICLAIPFGIIGVIWSFYLQGLEVNLMAIIGIIGMAGVVVNDSLLLVDTVNKKRTTWFDFHISQIVQGSSSRLRAIILTSITTLGGVFPMAYALGGDAGFTKNLAMSMGWGLLFATVLTLIALPCMLLIQRDFMVIIETKVLKRKKNQSINKDVTETIVPLNASQTVTKDKTEDQSIH